MGSASEAKKIACCKRSQLSYHSGGLESLEASECCVFDGTATSMVGDLLLAEEGSFGAWLVCRVSPT